MRWNTLLPTKRITKEQGDPLVPHRSPFAIDADRIVFSDAFRRLRDKTQVHGANGDDNTRNRLTHSLEVSRVGRSLGAMVGRVIVDRAGPGCPFDAADLSDVVSAAGLAHDVGNPPFGHSGEELISDFWRIHKVGRQVIEGVDPQTALEATHHEGNAQGFRTLCRLQGWRETGGLQLTCATLAAFSKYPFPAASVDGRVPRHLKYGFFGSEAAMFDDVAHASGMIPGDRPGRWKRHPLAHLVEAADDICYRVVDLEDAVGLRLLTFTEVEEMLVALSNGFVSAEYRSISTPARKLSYLRSQAMERLLSECATIFLDAGDAVLDGTFPGDLVMQTGARADLERIAVVSRERIYENDRRREIDLRASHAIDTLLENYCTAFLEREAAEGDVKSMPKRYQFVLRSFPGAAAIPVHDRSAWVRAVLDHVSGMTDGYAFKTASLLLGKR